MEISIFDIIENGVSNKEISIVIEKLLNEKYNEEFLVKMIGGRYGTATNDNVTTYCSSQNKPNNIFTAVLNREQSILEDDYKLRCMAFELEEFIKKEFKANNIDVIVKTDIIGVNQLNEFIDVQEFIDKFKNTNFLTYIISKNKITKEILIKVYDSIKRQYKDIYLKSLIYLADEKGFEKCYKISTNYSVITDTIIEKFAIEQFIIKIKDGKIDIIK